MEIITNNEYCIITPFAQKADKYEMERIYHTVSACHAKRVALNLGYVKDCTIDFLEGLGKIENISLFNIPSDIFVIINCMNLDRIFNLYVSKLDFINKKRRILNRKFSVITS